jgi:hypothetical protein
VQDEIVLLALELGLSRLVNFKGVQVFQEKQLGRLLGVIQFAGTTRVLMEDVIDVFKCLFEHEFFYLWAKDCLWGEYTKGSPS